MSSDVSKRWPTARLDEVADLCLGKMLDKEKNRGELRPYLANVNVRWGRFDLQDLREMPFEERELDRYGLRYGDIVMCEGGEPGRCAIWTDEVPGIMIQKALHRIRPRKVADSHYLYYALTHGVRSGSFDELMTGSGIKHLPGNQVARLEVLTPPLDEQRRIAEVLRSVDEAIAAAEAAASMAENLLIRVRDEMISQPIWGATTLAEATLGGMFTDGDWVESKDQDPGGEVRLIQLADIGDGFFVDKSKRYLTMERAHELRCTFLEEGDLLIARMPDPLGRCCLLPAISQPSVTVVDVCVVRASPITSNRYLNHALATSEFRLKVLACASGTTRTRVSRGNLGRLELAMPPLVEQEAIADELDQISIVAGRQRAAAEQLKDLKGGLMSDLLSGRVRVPA